MPTILLLSGIILEVVLAGLAVSQLFSSSILNEQLSIQALKAAESGAHDAIIRINDYINCPNATYCPSTYTLIIGNHSACVNIGSIVSGQMTIRSKGTAFTREKTIKVVLGIITNEAKVEVQSFKEIENPGDFTSCS